MRHAASLLLLAAAPSAECAADARARFDAFKQRFGKTYSDAGEEARRAAVFSANLARVSELNALEAAAGNKYPPYGITPFMDVAPDEFRASHLGYKPSAHRAKGKAMDVPRNASRQRQLRTAVAGGVNASAPRADFDVYSYCPSSDCSPVQNQGACGDCWAFTSTEVLETQISLGGGGLTRLSPQELADCLTTACTGSSAGGDTPMGWDFAKKNGISTLAAYPITSTSSGKLGTCRESKVSTGQVSSYSACGTNDENTMLGCVQNHGPISVGVDANNWQFYDGGRMSRADAGGDPGCSMMTTASCSRNLDHSVSVVGWTTVKDDSSKVNGWVIRNHWSTGWGCQLGTDESAAEGGYAFLAAGSDTCGVAEDPISVTP